MTHPVDLHIIHFNEPKWMLDRCLASLDGQPANIHIIKGTEEFPPFLGRAKGYAAGTAPYATYVDPDDEVLPGAIEKLLEYSGADLIWGNELVKMPDGREVISKAPHHLFLKKREKSSRRTKAHINELVYVWNVIAGTRYSASIGKKRF